LNPSEGTAARLEELIAANVDNPTRELLWGSPGTMLAALFLHERSGEARWADAFRTTARKLWSQLLWSPEHECHYWTQDMYGHQAPTSMACNGFVATASPLIRGRHLLEAEEWTAWEQCIANTIQRTATREGPLANWRAVLDPPPDFRARRSSRLCHGAPGFVICLGDMPGTSLDELLLAGAETTWQAGPLNKGSNLCHGTGGNGYAFLKLYRRTRDAKWLERAARFAMHGIAQTEADAATYGRMRYSLWTGDPGFAIYSGIAFAARRRFPSLDVFLADRYVGLTSRRTATSRSASEDRPRSASSPADRGPARCAAGSRPAPGACRSLRSWPPTSKTVLKGAPGFEVLVVVAGCRRR
jgi:hypothetical protein